MATLNSMVPLVRMHARNCPEPAIEDALLFAAREFVRKTRWLRETLTVSVLANTNVYALTSSTPTVTEVVGVKAVELNGSPLSPRTQEEVQDDTYGYYYIEPPADLLLAWLPDADDADALEVRVVLQLLTSPASIPDALVRRWDNAISYGALERLLSMKDAAWFWPEGAAMFASKWSHELGRAQVEADRQMTMQGFRTRAYS